MCGKEINKAEQAMAEVVTNVRAGISLEDVNKAITNLNIDQTIIFSKIKGHLNSDSTENLRMFVSGCGGTGKSYLINTIAQWLSATNANAKSISVAITAPTGLAAYNVGGVIIHRLLMLPVEHGSTAKYEELSSTSLSIVCNTLIDLKLLIIDEISMGSSLLLTYIHLCLWEITG